MPKPKKSQQPVPQGGEIILYQTEDGQTRIQCRFASEAIWLTQKLMGELFQKDIRTVNEHLHNIYKEAELDPAATIRKFRIVQAERSPNVGPPRRAGRHGQSDGQRRRAVRLLRKSLRP